MIKNSAHDDITMLVEKGSTEYKQAIESISRLPGNEQFLKIIKIIENIAKDSSKNIQSIEQTLTLATEDNVHKVLIKASDFTSQDKPTIQPTLAHHENTTQLTREDMRAIQDGNFTLDLYIDEVPEPYTLSELLSDMALYEIGRPSNIASNIDFLTRNELVHLNNDGLTLTTLGTHVAKILLENEPFLASENFTQALNTAAHLIATGQLTNEQALSVLINQTFETDITEKHYWSHEDELYKKVNEHNQYKGGVIGRNK